MRRLVVKLIIAMVATVLPIVAVAVPAQADTGDQFVAKINALRASKGLGALRVDAQLSAFAQAWTDKMAAADVLSHNPNLANAPGDWTKAGENVGVGVEVDTLFDAFVASPHHYENLVDPAFNTIGIGVTVVNGKLWTTHNFEALPVARTTATTATKPVTTAPRTPTPAAAPTTTAAPRRVTPATTPATVAPARPAQAQPVALHVSDPEVPSTAPASAAATASVPVAPAAPAPTTPVAPARIRFSLDQVRGLDPVI